MRPSEKNKYKQKKTGIAGKTEKNRKKQKKTRGSKGEYRFKNVCFLVCNLGKTVKVFVIKLSYYS